MSWRRSKNRISVETLRKRTHVTDTKPKVRLLTFINHYEIASAERIRPATLDMTDLQSEQLDYNTITEARYSNAWTLLKIYFSTLT